MKHLKRGLEKGAAFWRALSKTDARVEKEKVAILFEKCRKLK